MILLRSPAEVFLYGEGEGKRRKEGKQFASCCLAVDIDLQELHKQSGIRFEKN